MPHPRALPEDSVLLRHRDIEGLSLAQIGAKYGVSKVAVHHHFDRMDRATGGNAPIDYQSIIPWDIERDHQASYAAQRLRAHIRAVSDIPLTPAAEKRLADWYKRLRNENVVLDYQSGNVGSPWVYVKRTPQDQDLLIRWPEDGGPISALQRACLTLPASE